MITLLLLMTKIIYKNKIIISLFIQIFFKAMDHPEDEIGEVPNLIKYRPDKLVSYPGFSG